LGTEIVISRQESIAAHEPYPNFIQSVLAPLHPLSQSR